MKLLLCRVRAAKERERGAYRRRVRTNDKVAGGEAVGTDGPRTPFQSHAKREETDSSTLANLVVKGVLNFTKFMQASKYKGAINS